jgi:hypothetical protein
MEIKIYKVKVQILILIRNLDYILGIDLKYYYNPIYLESLRNTQ